MQRERYSSRAADRSDLTGLIVDCRAAFSSVLAGNQIAGSVLSADYAVAGLLRTELPFLSVHGIRR
jgi:hypothetical protein